MTLAVAFTVEVAAVLQVPTSLAGLLSLLAPCFTQPTFQTFSMLLVGFVGRIRDCTITGMLQAAGLAGVWHHSRAHDLFARRRWNPDELGLRLLDFLVVVFVNTGPIRLAVDDTLFGRSGRRVFGARYLHDGAQPEGSGRRTRWGNCWVVVVLVVELGPRWVWRRPGTSRASAPKVICVASIRDSPIWRTSPRWCLRPSALSPEVCSACLSTMAGLRCPRSSLACCLLAGGSSATGPVASPSRRDRLNRGAIDGAVQDGVGNDLDGGAAGIRANWAARVTAAVWAPCKGRWPG
jgi:DDE superfamily endonuclease